MADTDKKEEELVLHEDIDGSAIVGDLPDDDDDDDDAPVKATEDDAHDEQGHASETAEDAAARRERNRARRKESKERRGALIDGLKRDLAARDSIINELNQRISVVERKSTGSEMAQLEQAEREAVQYYNHYKEVHSNAVAAANGTIATDAQEKMYVARQKLEQIGNIKKAVTNQKAQPAALDPRMVSNAKGWMEKNDWYDPSGNDEDSGVVLALDNKLAQRGFNPTTPEYWDELDKQVKKYLPHRVKSGNNGAQGTRPRSPVASSGGESSNSRSNGSYRLSAERVSAIKEAGAWDDPVARAKMVKAYQRYDKEQGAQS